MTATAAHAGHGGVEWRSSMPSRDLTGALHLWRIRLDVPDAVVASCTSLLAPDEMERAARFHFESDRRRFVVTRGTTRHLLGFYLGMGGGEVAFGYGPLGKPFTAESVDIRFNVSHAGTMALVGIALGVELGVDVELIRPLSEGMDSVLAPGERQLLRELPASKREEAFFACWTRKEAYLKARGDGMWFALDRFEVSVTPGEPPALLCVHGDPAEAGRWVVVDVPPAPGYAAALIAERGPWQLATYDAAAVPLAHHRT